MTSRDFCYWLQGFFELKDATTNVPLSLNPTQTETVRKHLALVFIHEIDPSAGPPEHQAKLDEVHGPQPKPPATIGGVGPGGIAYRC